ncbi:MAG: hypothetical protein E6J39_03335 [Chloroflexi bacterium]|nr:MAG: hypothetical protein E6J39_03335 [Chloroflexota bacterium]
MASELVAAGDGAFTTWSVRPSVDTPNPCGMRLQLPKPLGSNQLKVGHAVLLPASIELFERGQLGLVERHDDLADRPDIHLVPGTEVDEGT